MCCMRFSSSLIFFFNNQKIINIFCFGISNAWFVFVEELPDSWSDAPDIHSLRSMDRSFVFPGILFSFDS